MIIIAKNNYSTGAHYFKKLMAPMEQPKNGKTLIFKLGQKLEILCKYVSPDFFVDWFVHPLPIFSEEN